MSFKFIQQKIEQYLASDKAEVLALYGAWGVGKTHTWNNTVKDLRCRISNQFKNYSYVSLFGIRSLEQLKGNIFENMVDAHKIGDEISSFYEMKQNLVRNLENKEMGIWNKIFLWVGKKIPFFSDWSKLKYLGPLVDYVIGISIRDAVICFDDIERNNPNFSIDQILGYINFLKEERNCKIVIIGNEKKIDGGKYKEWNEKVIDKRLELSVFSEECCELIIPKDRLYRKNLFHYIGLLQLKNMRVISIIDSLTNDLINILPEIETETWDHIIKILCLFCTCQYTVDEEIPRLDFLLDHGKKLPQVFASDKKGEFEKVKLFLHRYKFYGFISVDFLIADAVVSGFFKDHEVVIAVTTLDEQIKNEKQREVIHSMWDSFNDGFSDNLDKVVSDLKEGYYNNRKEIGINNVDAILFTLRKIKKNDIAKEICEDYVKYLKEEKIVVTEKSCYFLNQLRDTDFLEALEKMSSEISPQISLDEAIDHISHNNGWSPEYINVLERADINEYFEYLRKLKGDVFSEKMRSLSVFKSNNNDSYKVISEKINSALKKICGEDHLNRFRIELLGYDLN